MLYAHDLNMGNGNRLTTSVWDDNVANWMLKIQNYVQSSAGVWVPLALDANGYLKSSVKDSALPAGAATAAKQDTIIGAVDGVEGILNSLDTKIFLTQTAATSILAKIIAAPATEAKQDTIIGAVDGVEALLTAIRDTAGIKKITDPVDVSDKAARILGKVTSEISGRTVDAEHTFQNAAVATGEGTHLTLNGKDKVVVAISGTSTSRTISFKATGPNSVVGYVLGSKIGSGGSIVVSSGTIGNSEIWEIEGLAGYTDFFISLDAVAGGNVTAKGRLVA